MTKKPKKKSLPKPAKAAASKAPKNPKKAAAAPANDAAIAPTKAKRIHGGFSMPATDYALIGELKTAAKKSGRVVKKNEVLRAGLHALKGMTNDGLLAALAALQPTKPARKKKAA